MTYDEPKNCVNRVEDFTRFYLKREWLLDSMVQQMIKDIDHNAITIVNDKPYIESPILGAISPYELSGGVKSLIMLLKMDEIFDKVYVFRTSAFGHNCYPWLFKIAEIKDVYLYVTSYFRLPKYTGTNRYGYEDRLYFEYGEGYKYDTLNLNNKRYLTTYDELYVDTMSCRAGELIYE